VLQARLELRSGGRRVHAGHPFKLGAASGVQVGKRHPSTLKLVVMLGQLVAPVVELASLGIKSVYPLGQAKLAPFDLVA
jgi:hypothetical protein